LFLLYQESFIKKQKIKERGTQNEKTHFTTNDNNITDHGSYEQRRCRGENPGGF
jgi:hypothetical protein